MPRYILMLHEDPSQFAEMSASDMQAVVSRYMAWSDDMAKRGALVSGEKLTDDGGRVVRRSKSGINVTDGPFSEAKEVIGGFFVLQADSLADAEALAATCPHLEHGWIVLRSIEST